MSLPEAYQVSYSLKPKYPNGYLLKFTTWENDGDDYKTQEMSGVESAQDMAFLVNLAEMFTSRNAKKSGMGNDDQSHETLCEVVSDLLQKFDVSDDLRDELTPMLNEESEGELQTWLNENILGKPEGYDFGFCRVMDTIQVFLVQDPIVQVERKDL